MDTTNTAAPRPLLEVLAEHVAEVEAQRVPVHKRPSSCHVCGTPVPNREGATRPDCWHDLTNAEAEAAALEHDRRTVVTYAGGQHTAEAAYVDATRGR